MDGKIIKSGHRFCNHLYCYTISVFFFSFPKWLGLQTGQGCTGCAGYTGSCPKSPKYLLYYGSTRHARHRLFLFPGDYGTVLPPKPSFSSFMEPVLSSLTVTIVLLFALEPSSLHENIVLRYVALQLPLFQCFVFGRKDASSRSTS